MLQAGCRGASPYDKKHCALLVLEYPDKLYFQFGINKGLCGKTFEPAIITRQNIKKSRFRTPKKSKKPLTKDNSSYIIIKVAFYVV